MPSMSRMEAAGDAKSMMQMNARANAMVGMLLFPLLGFMFAFAEDLVSLVYTASYVDAAPVMRVYILGMIALVVELSSVLQLLRQGMFSLGMNVIVLALAVPLSWFGDVELGLSGAAAGSVCALYVDRTLILQRIAAISGDALQDQGAIDIERAHAARGGAGKAELDAAEPAERHREREHDDVHAEREHALAQQLQHARELDDQRHHAEDVDAHHRRGVDVRRGVHQADQILGESEHEAEQQIGRASCRERG